MVNGDRQQLESIMRDFRRARRRAALEAILARLRGSSADLLPYEEVRKKLKGAEAQARGVKTIPLDAIVGSVGRYPDFTRKFLPKRDTNKDRWARVKMLMSNPTMAELPPIDVYKIGDAYFVADGNHRVSVAREQGATKIRAHVTEIETRVPLSPEDDLDDVIRKAEFTDFLDRTDVDTLYPDLDLTTTVPGQYSVIEHRIDVYHRYLTQREEQEVPYQEAVRAWYEEDYLPVVEVIRERGLLRDFPDRTETDLYVWTLKHRERLQESLGWSVDTEFAADDLADQYSTRPGRILKRFGRRLLEVVPDDLEAGPEPGHWRVQHVETRDAKQLFADILVTVNGKESGWYAVDQAIAIARREGSRLKGLHVVSDIGDLQREPVQHIEAEFQRRCDAAGITGELAVDTGDVSRVVCDRAEWADLVVVSITYAPGTTFLERLGSGLRRIVQRCSRPVLTVPSTPIHPLRRALLAYDGSRKADEALFVAAYLAQMWDVSLTVVAAGATVNDAEDTIERARTYLSRYDIAAEYRCEVGRPGPVIMAVGRELDTDLIIMGGFGAGPVVELVVGSTVEQVLRTSWKPTLVCR